MSVSRHRIAAAALLLFTIVAVWLVVPDRVAAQNERWRVLTITPGEEGARKLQAALNEDIWELHSLHMSTIQGAPAIAVLKKP